MIQHKLVKAGQKFCEENGHRFTDHRRDILDIVARAKKPITAYEILGALNKKSGTAKPPIIYRATDFWQAHGFLHKIESLNAFVACQENHQHRGSQFMICDTCGKAFEIHLCHIPQAITEQIESHKFSLSYWNLELHGTCKSCRH